MSDTLASIEAGSTAGAEKRRSSRIPLTVPITVSGVDALGEPFRELTTTLSVSCNGCKYKSKNYVQRDSLVTLEVPHPNARLSPRVVKGRARWVQRPRNLREQYEIGLELIVSGNIWGIASPPPDWFAHPDDEAPPQTQIVEAGVVEGLTGTAVSEGDAAGLAASSAEADIEVIEQAGEANREISPAAFEEIDLTKAIGFAAHESETAPATPDLHARLRETIATSLKAMANRIAEDAARHIAARIDAVLDEVRAASGMAAEELEQRIREALDDALHPEEMDEIAASAEKQSKKRARKNRKKGRQPDDTEAGDR